MCRLSRWVPCPFQPILNPWVPVPCPRGRSLTVNSSLVIPRRNEKLSARSRHQDPPAEGQIGARARKTPLPSRPIQRQDLLTGHAPRRPCPWDASHGPERSAEKSHPLSGMGGGTVVGLKAARFVSSIAKRPPLRMSATTQSYRSRRICGKFATVDIYDPDRSLNEIRPVGSHGDHHFAHACISSASGISLRSGKLTARSPVLFFPAPNGNDVPAPVHVPALFFQGPAGWPQS